MSCIVLSFRNDAVLMNPIWRMQNGQGPSWKYAQAKIESENNFQVRNRFFSFQSLSISLLSSSLSWKSFSGQGNNFGFSHFESVAQLKFSAVPYLFLANFGEIHKKKHLASNL